MLTKQPNKLIRSDSFKLFFVSFCFAKKEKLFFLNFHPSLLNECNFHFSFQQNGQVWFNTSHTEKERKALKSLMFFYFLILFEFFINLQMLLNFMGLHKMFFALVNFVIFRDIKLIFGSIKKLLSNYRKTQEKHQQNLLLAILAVSHVICFPSNIFKIKISNFTNNYFYSFIIVQLFYHGKYTTMIHLKLLKELKMKIATQYLFVGKKNLTIDLLT